MLRTRSKLLPVNQHNEGTPVAHPLAGCADWQRTQSIATYSTYIDTPACMNTLHGRSAHQLLRLQCMYVGAALLRALPPLRKQEICIAC